MVALRDVPLAHGGQQEHEGKPDDTADQITRLESELLFRESAIPPWRFAFLCVGLSLGLLMAMMDASIVATSLYTIGTDFNDLEHINWIALAYTLAFLGCSVFFASMADVVGRRNAFIAAFVLFFAFSLGCGFSQDMNSIIACRAFQGIGGAGLFSVTMIIFPELTPPNYTNRIAPLIGMIISTGGVLGPILGGVFTKYVSWRWVFWIKSVSWPFCLFRNHVFAASTLNTVFLGFAYLATLFAVPLRLQVVNGKSPIMAGILMLPMLGGTGIGSALTGMFSKKQNHLSETMTVATAMVMLGLALETTVTDSLEVEPKFLGFLVFIGLGYGMIASSATMFTSLESPIPEHAPAQGIISQSRMLGGSIGIAMSSAVLAAQQRTHLVGIVSPAALADLKGAEANLTEAQLAVIRKTYNDSFTETMKVCAIVAGVGVLITLGTYRRGRLSIAEQRQQQVRKETERRRAEKESVGSNASNRSA
ncbi:hypothetical protein M406DRAFT_39663 [Cryphonectria parasitica EP155]|uniref:Major facilitator superfamily (MFS) profile domain-containing protein n=1 Tax=Cryphonectria parasitica (strain ATCC 38755 / EP155) TaxID=660469 RepID=A0A9P5CQF6_CRYP1|nr:uncharacterized protein M406DRAFT_39663 [Cryphonectria parasitica EP155]KAF3767479.1 hypothetical protein M406DRAFT_39663 [Cryphonectria parasitica EP155]